MSSCSSCALLSPQLCKLAAHRSKDLALHAAMAFLSFEGAVAQVPTPVPVPTWRYELTHAGQNTNETALTPSNVNTTTFGKLFSQPLDGAVHAQPLYVPGLTMGDGLLHNVVFVATENDTLYALDADSNGGINAGPIWKASMLSTAHGAAPGATPVTWVNSTTGAVSTNFGISGTPTINLGTNTIYFVAATEESGIHIVRLHAINILTGAEQSNSPVEIDATVPGNGLGSSGGEVAFSAYWQIQRTALDYYNGYVYFGFGSHGDYEPWHGWLFAYDANTLQQTAVLCLAPDGNGAGIWGSGAGLPIDDVDPAGRLFVVTGNGTISNYPPIEINTGFGESILDLNLANGGLAAVDAFTSFNAHPLNASDLDQGSGGILMIPDQPGPYPHIMVQAGKEGRLLVLNRDALGGYASGASSNTNILQDIPGQIGGLFSTPAYWNGNVYIWGSEDVPKAFSLSNGVLSTTPSSQSTISSGNPGASFVVSANGNTNGIAWAVRTDEATTAGPAILYAWDATNLANELYESDTNSARDGAGRASRFAVPVVTNGKVYAAAVNVLDVYGVFSQARYAPPPVIFPNGGNVVANQSVTLSTSIPSAAIYYTLDGSAPTPASKHYTGPITVTQGVTVNAIVSATGYIWSPVSSATFAVTAATPPVTILPDPGTYSFPLSITMSDPDANASIYYTTDGSNPSAASHLYTGAISALASETINAIAIDPSLAYSPISSSAYTIVPSTSINFAGGFTSTAGMTLNGASVTITSGALQLTNGQLNQAGSAFWSQPIGVKAFTTSFSFQLVQAKAEGITFTIQNVGPNALGKDQAGIGFEGIKKSVAVKFDIFNNAGEGSDSTGIFKNGAKPTVPAKSMSKSGVNLRSGDPMVATIKYNGKTLSVNITDSVNAETYKFSQSINIPQIVGGNTAYVGFTGSTGTNAATQEVLTWSYTSH